ncbi:MAG: FAD binding domain-containing protein [Planctomycetota bacterium]|jgi:carbon-monoxide dehydrogenase medium subunit
MHLPDIEVHNAATLEEAAGLMARHAPAARLLAGGTDVLVDLRTRRIDVAHLVSLNRIDALRGISETDDGLRIGALATVTDVERSRVVRAHYAPLLDAASKMAAPNIRNAATVGGNIAGAVPCADLPPILAAMKASVVLWSPGGDRRVPVEQVFTGPRATVLKDGEVLKEVIVPKPPPRSGAAYARFGLRDGNTIAVAAVAAGLLLSKDGVTIDARIVLGAVAPVPKLAKSAGAALVGRPPGPEAFRLAAEAAEKEAEPISDVRGSAEFRRRLVGVLTHRALSAALQRAEEIS